MTNKFILVGLLVIFRFVSYAQTYEYGAAFGSGIFVKTSGSFIISDTTVQTKALVNGNEVIQNFKRKPSTSPLVVYYTDGVQTFMLNIQSETGRKKGYDYEYLIVLSNLNTPNYYFSYFCNQQK